MDAINYPGLKSVLIWLVIFDAIFHTLATIRAVWALLITSLYFFQIPLTEYDSSNIAGGLPRGKHRGS